MIIKYKNVSLEIYVNNKYIDYNINKDLDINKVKNEFNKTIEELSLKYDSSLSYWSMRLSERNTLINDLFLDFCNIELIMQLYKKYKNIVVYTNNVSLFLKFQDIGYISFKDKFKFKIKKIIEEYKPYIQFVKFIFDKSVFYLKYSDKKYKKNLSNTTIIQTWISDSNFKDNNTFYDSYYKNLSDHLKQNGRKVIIWPVFYNVHNKQQAIKFIRKNSNNFLLIEDYINFYDYLFMIKIFFTKRFLNLGSDSILNFYQKKERIEYSVLFYRFIKNISSMKNIKFIQHYENMIPEKMLVLGIRKYLKDGKVIGYFHTTKPKNLFCLEYSGKREYNIAPKPDIVIFNSYKYKNYFISKYNIKGYNGIAFKQVYLKNKSKTTSSINCRNKNILIIFSGTMDDVIFMFNLLNSIKLDYNFIFRMHPMNRFKVEQFYNRNNFIIENEILIDNLFLKYNICKVISTYSALALEIALYGIKVGLIYNKKRLLLNPFDDTGILNYKLISSVCELKEFLVERYNIINNIEQIFNISDEDINIFLEVTK